MRLSERVAIVTGGAKGIGGAIARRFVAEGARVMIADIDVQAAQANLERIAASGGQALFTATDVSDSDQVDRLFDQALGAYGQLDILVNNAGIVHGSAA